MARIFQRGDKWYVDYRVNGRRIWKSVGTRKALAEDFLKDIEGKRVRGELMDIKETKAANFDDFARDYAEKYGPNKVDSTRARDAVTIEKHLIPFFGRKPLKQITASDIEEYKAKRRAARLKDKVQADGTVIKGKQIAKSTINREVGLLRSLLNRAVEWGYLKDNPSDQIKKFKEEEREPCFLESHEARKLMDTASDQLKTFVIIALNTGMRKGELFNLKWSDVNFDRREIIVRKSKSKRFRVIPMNEMLVDTLQKHPRHIKGQYVIYNPDGTQRRSIQNAFDRLHEAAGFDNLRIHDLRHTFISNLVMAGEDLRTVQELAGHRDIRTTMRYAHLSPGKLAKSVEKLTWDAKPEGKETGS